MPNSVTPTGVEHEQGRSPLSLTPYHTLARTRVEGGIPAWLRIWAMLTACAALPLVTLGAEVTTKRVGMVDSQGFRAPWHLFTLSGDQLSLGYLIEHGHRLAGFVVGFACIVLALGLTVQGRDSLHRFLGWFALAMVILQGVLGIYRVNLHALMGSSLALVHGCFAQLVFSSLAAVAVLCSRAWNQPTVSPTSSTRLWSVGLCLLVYLQIVFGAMLRHLIDPMAQRLHILLAFAVVLAVFSMAARLHAEEENRTTRLIAYLLAGLVVLQPILGVEAWIRRFGASELPDIVPSSFGLDLSRSGHHILGTLIFATSVALALMLNRRPAIDSAIDTAVPEPRLEGMA